MVKITKKMQCFQTSNNAKKTSSYSFRNNNTYVFNLGRVQKSIFGGITLIFNHSFHASWHALHQSFTLDLGDLMPLLAQKVKQFSFVWWLVTIHLPLDYIPEVFNGVQVWRLGWPWQGLDQVVLHPHLDWPSCVAWSIFLLEKNKQSSEFGNTARAEGSKCSSRITLYVAWFMRPSQRRICPIPALLKHPQIITDPPPNFTVGARHCGLYASPGFHLTIRRSGVGQSWKLDLSEKMTLVLYGPILMVFCKLQPGSSLLLIDEGL